MSKTKTTHSRQSAFSTSFFLSGATASGKTALGVLAAKELGAEIVSLDSMAVYRGMDIGTAKPTTEERKGVAHHMIDVADPACEYSLMEYLKGAEEVVKDVESRGKRALFVGGSPLYLKAILFGVFESPSADMQLRDALNQREKETPGTLWRELNVVDPLAAAKLHQNDTKRLVRALEVYSLTGVPISSLQTQFDAHPLVDPRRVFILTRPREELYRRINRRVELMVEDGFLDEVRHLTEGGFTLGPTASKAVGYREMVSVLRGEESLENAIERVSQSTRNFAKRQETWFRSLTKLGAERLEAQSKTTEELCREFVAALRTLEPSL